MTWHVEILDHRVVKDLDALAPDVRQRFLRIAELIGTARKRAKEVT